MIRPINIADIEDIRVGHAQNMSAVTGCTVILCEGGAVGGIDVRGGAPRTRETIDDEESPYLNYRRKIPCAFIENWADEIDYYRRLF